MLDETFEALRSAALGATDASGYFPAMYARVTRVVMDRAANGQFDDRARMARFVDAFAARYLRARSEPASGPRCWRSAFDVDGDGRLLVVQHLFLGINAHVNFDLPITVAGLAGDGPVEPLRPDFLAVNDALEETYRTLLGDLDRVTRWVGRVAAMGGGHLFNFSLRAARDQAWRAAVRLHGEDGDRRATDEAMLDDLVCVLAALIARPTVPFRWLVPLVRRLEAHDPVKVTRQLLGPFA
jgi:hypothetical protein